MNETQQLVAAYVAAGSETAFQEIVRRYVDLVHSTALRLAGGDAHLAQDICQTVFIQLARNAHKLSPEITLGGWLHRVTCNTAGKMLRSERRRLSRETEAMLMNAPDSQNDAGLEQLRPVLDEAINQLAEADRSAIVLRFFEQCDFRAVGLALGSNEDAARMRVNRALDKLQGILRQRGVTLSTAALGAALTAGAVSAAPAGLALAVAGGALAGAATGGGAGAALGILHLMSQFKAGIAAAILVTGLAGTLVIQYRSGEAMRAENEALRKQVKAMESRTHVETAPRLIQHQGLSDEERTELLRLRGEMGLMRSELAESQRRQVEIKKASEALAQQLDSDKVKEKEIALAKKYASSAKQWMLAFRIYAEEKGKFPETFEQAADELHDVAKREEMMQLAKDFEVFPVSDPDNVNPSNTIAMRGKPLPLSSGGWQRIYGMVDGSAHIVVATDGNFAAAEVRLGLVYPPKP